MVMVNKASCVSMAQRRVTTLIC